MQQCPFELTPQLYVQLMCECYIGCVRECMYLGSLQGRLQLVQLLVVNFSEEGNLI